MHHNTGLSGCGVLHGMLLLFLLFCFVVAVIFFPFCQHALLAVAHKHTLSHGTISTGKT